MLDLWFNDWLNKHSSIEHLMCLIGKLFEWVRLWYDLLPDPNEINQMIEVHERKFTECFINYCAEYKLK